MAQGVTPDGINPNARINPTTERKLYKKVVDNVLNSRTFMARLMGNGKPFNGKTFDVPIKITDSGLGEYFTGLETLSSAASDTLIELSYAHTAFAQPVVSVMLESFANSGPEQSIDLDVFKLEEAVSESIQSLGSAVFGMGTGSQPLGLEAHVDDGTNTSTIGGQSRTTYSGLNSTVTASGGTLTLAKLATLESAVCSAGIESEYPTLHLTTKTVWDLYERLLQPSVRAEYSSIGYPALSLRGNAVSRSRAELKGAAGFTSISYRGIPVIADEACTSGVWYMLNERYLEWRGRNIVPSKYAGVLEKVSLSGNTMEGVAAQISAPSDAGWFFQKMQAMPNQAGMVGRFYVIGQVVGSQPRRQGKLTGITTV
jgi:hypothetical protein